MLGKKNVRQESLFGPVSRETRVSKELTAVKQIVNFDWFRQESSDKFCRNNGRPSIAPETMGAIMFLGYWFNITSDRELCDECEDRLSFRKFIGLSDDDEIPVHSSFTHWRQRLGRDVFQRFLAHTVELAKQKGITPGRCRLFDSTLVKAQADVQGCATVRLDPTKDTNDYLDALGYWDIDEEVGNDKDCGKKGGSSPRDIGKADRKAYQKRKLARGWKIMFNTNDPEARYLSKPGKKLEFCHKCHFEFDLKTGLVMNADAGHISDATKMVDMLSREIEPCDTVGADTGYFTAETQQWLKKAGIESYISVRDNAANRGVVFGLDAFSYVAEKDEYICPNGIRLTRQNRGSDKEKRYASPRGSCVGCEYAAYCFINGKAADRRQIGLSPERELVEEAKLRNMSYRYHRIMKKRSIICEGSIGTMKSYGGLGRIRGIGEDIAAIQAAMAGAVHNIKKILKHITELEKATLVGVITAVSAIFGLFRQDYLPGRLEMRLLATWSEIILSESAFLNTPISVPTKLTGGWIWLLDGKAVS